VRFAFLAAIVRVLGFGEGAFFVSLMIISYAGRYAVGTESKPEKLIFDSGWRRNPELCH
jgi:hypothetical protein